MNNSDSTSTNPTVSVHIGNPVERKSSHALSQPEQSSASHGEDEDLLKSKRIKDSAIAPSPLPVLKSMKSLKSQRSMISDTPVPPVVKISGFRKKLKEFMNGRLVEGTVVALIVIYVLIVMANIVLDDGSISTNIQIKNCLNVLRFVELGILGVFMLEIALKVWASGFRGYFKDCWYIMDAIIILITFGLVIVDIKLSNDSFSGLSKIRGLFRLFRIFMLMRKANQFSRVTKFTVQISGVDIKSPVEKILDLLESLKQTIKNKKLAAEIDWAIDIISHNKLYEPLLDSSGDEDTDKADANAWLKNYSKAHSKPANKRGSTVNGRETAQRMSLLSPPALKNEPSSMLQSTKISKEAFDLLDLYVDEIEFDVFSFQNLANGDELVYSSCYLFQRHNLFEFLNISQVTFTKFMKRIQAGYLLNPYHNATHATDVLQSTNYLMTTGEFIGKADLTSLEIAAMYLSAAIHDFEHPGTNNTFHVNTNSAYAIRYNDKGVLENHHVAAAFTLLKEESLNIFTNFPKADYKTIRERMIAMVLATDMSNHFADIGKLKGRLAADYDIKDKDKNFTMELIIHAADISNPTKPWETSFQWSTKVIEEFFDQGDKERVLNLPITYLCDRYTVNVAKSQIGFIDFVVAPFFSLIKEILPKIDISNMEINKNKWKEQIDKYEEELVQANQQRAAKAIA